MASRSQHRSTQNKEPSPSRSPCGQSLLKVTGTSTPVVTLQSMQFRKRCGWNMNTIWWNTARRVGIWYTCIFWGCPEWTRLTDYFLIKLKLPAHIIYLRIGILCHLLSTCDTGKHTQVDVCVHILLRFLRRCFRRLESKKLRTLRIALWRMKKGVAEKNIPGVIWPTGIFFLE